MKTLSQIYKNSIPAFLLLLFSQVGFSQMQIKSRSFGQYFDAIEGTPVFNGEKALITMPIGFSIGTENVLEENYKIVSEFRYYTVSDQRVGSQEGLYLSGQDLSRQNFHSFTLLSGIRYYTNPYTNSWYGDFKVGFERVSSSYDGASINVKETSHSIPFIMELGHRFVLDSSYTLRFGARMSERYILSQQLRNADSDESLKVDDISYNIPSALNVSLGYHF